MEIFFLSALLYTAAVRIVTLTASGDQSSPA
jgi:hypothetical protein